MLKQLILENWKSFRHAVLDIDPLTVLIGTNASGKSNAIEALEFLRRTTSGETIESALKGNTILPPIRGSIDWATLKSATQFTLQVLVQGEDENIDYLYSITIDTTSELSVNHEALIQIEKNKNIHSSLFEAVRSREKLSDTNVKLYATPPKSDSRMVISNPPMNQKLSVLYVLHPTSVRFNEEISRGIEIVSKILTSVFVLDPIPSKMRSYSSLSHDLASDASNIAGVLAALPEGKKAEIEATLTQYLSHLPDRDIQKIWAETVGRLNSDAMLYCEETWVPGEPPLLIDARGMSDGTLRFLAILTALLTRPEGSQLIIEDVDNGLHPSRANLLLKMLREIGEKRNIDVLVTTHNPALLNTLEPKYIPFVVVAHRDSQTGESKLTLLEDIDNLPKLLASASLGTIATQGLIEKSLTHQEQQA